MDTALIAERVLNLIVLLLSLTVHEFFHAWSAWRLGDDTAARMGRLTLNPIPHIDPIGTLLLPLLNAPIGWAKPVPVDSARFRRGIRMTTGDLIVSSAGPLSNFGFAVLATVIYGLLHRFVPAVVAPGQGASEFLSRLILVNVALGIFNLLPIPPLDGGHVAASLVPFRWRGAWDRFAQVAPLLLLALVFFGGRFLSGPIQLALGVLDRLLNAIA